MIMPKRHPEMIPAIGTVRTQERKIQASIFQLSALVSPLHNPTATVAPVIHCVVEIGMANWEASTTVMEAPSSIENPRDGECSVKRLPRTRIMLYPYVAKPRTMHAPPKTRIHTGTGALEPAKVPLFHVR